MINSTLFDLEQRQAGLVIAVILIDGGPESTTRAIGELAG